METRLLFVMGAIALTALGCEDRRKKQIETIDVDHEIVSKANGAVNEVIRNQADCEVAKPLMVEAYQRVEAARGQVRLEASRVTLDTLKAQVDRIAQVCP